MKTLILDQLAAVTNDLLHEVVTSADYNVRLLSIRKCPNVNQYKLQQLLQYVCRPGRTEGTPRLRGLYYFTDPLQTTSSNIAPGVTESDGAQLGAVPTSKTVAATGYYAPSGRVVHVSQTDAAFWAQTISACKGIIWFDAVLCTHMHAEMDSVVSDLIREQRPTTPTLATIALGTSGCTGCGRGPLEGPIWGQNNYDEFPLLWPPASTGNIVDATRPPLGSPNCQRLIVSCQWCIDSRHCDSCHRWWCADCYNPRKDKTLNDVDNLHMKASELDSKATSIKVHDGFCVEHCLRGELMAGAGEGGMWG